MAKYCCKNCGAELYFDPNLGKLHCEYCDSSYDPSEFEYVPENDAGKAAEKDKTIRQDLSEEEIDKAMAAGMTEEQAQAAAGDAQATDDSTGDLVVYRCPHCGAEVITSKDTAATTCVYCNRAITLEGNLAGSFKPDFIIPFKKTQKEVEAAYWKLCRKSPLTPRTFLNKNNIKKIKGMYVPFWLFSFQGDSRVSINAENVRTWRSGDTEYTEVTRFLVKEDVSSGFNRIPVDAVAALDNALMDAVEPFDIGELKPFNPAYLAGFYTQRWDDSADKNESRAKNAAHDALMGFALKRAGTYSSKSVAGESIDWTGQKTESAMMPIWMMHTEYKGKNYIFGMNGQTGKLMGEIPTSMSRIFGVLASTFVISQLVLMIIRVLGVLL